MAIDTAAKRISAANFLRGQTAIFPDGTIEQGDRQSAARTYSGILAGALALPTIGFLDAAIFIKSAISATNAIQPAIDGVGSIDPAINGTITTDS